MSLQSTSEPLLYTVEMVISCWSKCVSISTVLDGTFQYSLNIINASVFFHCYVFKKKIPLLSIVLGFTVEPITE